MDERVTLAVLRFYGHLASLPEDRLAGFLFRRRCAEVDDNKGRLSWCRSAKQKLEEVQQAEAWAAKAVPEDWKSLVKRETRQLFLQRSDATMESMSSLALFCRLRPASVAGWLDRAVRHPGAALRVKLRCGAAPVMQTVGAAAGIPREQRTCRICGSGAESNPLSTLLASV